MRLTRQGVMELYSRNRDNESRAGKIYYGRRQENVMPIIRQSAPTGRSGGASADDPLPSPPPFYSGTMYGGIPERSAENGQTEASQPPLSSERPTCGEHARDDIPQSPGQNIAGLNGEEDGGEVPVRIRPVRRTKQKPLRDHGENGYPREINYRAGDGQNLLFSLQQQLSALGQKLSGEDLLLIALTVMLLGSGADDLTILALVWLLLA